MATISHWNIPPKGTGGLRGFSRAWPQPDPGATASAACVCCQSPLWLGRCLLTQKASQRCRALVLCTCSSEKQAWVSPGWSRAIRAGCGSMAGFGGAAARVPTSTPHSLLGLSWHSPSRKISPTDCTPAGIQAELRECLSFLFHHPGLLPN